MRDSFSRRSSATPIYATSRMVAECSTPSLRRYHPDQVSRVCRRRRHSQHSAPLGRIDYRCRRGTRDEIAHRTSYEIVPEACAGASAGGGPPSTPPPKPRGTPPGPSTPPPLGGFVILGGGAAPGTSPHRALQENRGGGWGGGGGRGPPPPPPP